MKVFISHSSKDKKFVRTLKECLNENGIETFFDEDEIDLGDNLYAKLEKALNETSHLVIVLSPASINSKWVNYELKKALENQKTGITQKIIPIKYRECDIPQEINEYVYADLSNEVVKPNDEQNNVKFISKGFDGFLLSIVRALKSADKTFNQTEKAEIIKSLTQETEEQTNNQTHRGYYEIIGYANETSRTNYINKIKKAAEELPLNVIRPIMLPKSLEGKLNIKLGDKIEVISDNQFKSYGHFAGFRVDDLKLVLDKIVRQELTIPPGQIAQAEYYLDRRLIHITNGTKFNPGSYPGFSFTL